MTNTPHISIIVPLSGGPVQALRCFAAIAAQADDPAYEVIVVDDASVGLDGLLASLDGDVEVVRSEELLGFAAAARIGAERASGETIVLIRDAAQPAPGWLAPLAAAVADPSVGLATSVTAGDEAASPVTAWSFAIRSGELRDLGMPSVPGELVIGALALGLAERQLRVLPASRSITAPPGTRTGSVRRRPGEAPLLTIVIPTLDATSKRVRECVAAVQATTDVAHEIVVIDNGCPPQGFSGPVNAGLRAARTLYVVVMNDDVEPLRGWWPPLRAALDDGAAVAFPLTVDGPMRSDFAAWCFAMTQQSVAELSHAPGEFFDPSLVVWYQDTDLLHRLRCAGRPPVLVDGSRIRHGLSETVASEDPELSAWIRQQVSGDRERFLRKHPDAVLHGHVLASPV